MKRIKTQYPGVYYRLVRRIGKIPNQRGREGEYKERVYYITFKQGGRQVEEKVGSQYRDRMTESKAARIRGERIEKKRPSPKELRQAREEKTWTLEVLFDAWKKRPDLKKMSSEISRFNLYIRPALGKRLPHEIDALDMDRIRFQMQKEGKAPQSIKNTLRLLGRVINWGADRKYCQPLPFKIRPPKVSNLKTEDLTEDEMQRLMEAIAADTHPQAGNMIKLVLLTGMRRGELFKLRWEHVDFDRGFITLVNPKGGKDVMIPLSAEASELLRSIPRERSTPFVFPGRGGKMRKDIHKHTRKILDAASLPKDFRPLHGMRHTYASTLASSGKVELYTIQKLLGHKDAQTTLRYAHLRDQALREASNLAGSIIGESMKKKQEGTKDALSLGGVKKD
jgi:integrase